MDQVATERGPVGPRTVPLVVGCALLLVSVALAVEVVRGGPRRSGRPDAAPEAESEPDSATQVTSQLSSYEQELTGRAADNPDTGTEPEGSRPTKPEATEPGAAEPDSGADGTNSGVGGASYDTDGPPSGTDGPGDWRTVGLLVGVFLLTAALIEPLGFPLAGALLFWGAAYALGSRALVRDPLIAAVLALLTYVLFHTLLGVPLPGGPLMGVI
nr:tripartite tricarboxylate transporter TctB family protein [Streptomyces sp. AJS327]